MRTDYRRGKVTRRLAGEDPAVNEEWTCDKGRYAFRYATSNERLTTPLVRARRRAAAGLVAGGVGRRGRRAPARPATTSGVGVLTGGRLTVEDAYAYAKFARVVLGTNDVDCRARAHSAEEAAFLAATVAGTGPGTGAVTYDDLDRGAGGAAGRASSPRRSRRSSSCGCAGRSASAGLQVFDLAPFADAGGRQARRRPCWPPCPAPRRSRCGRSPTARGAARRSRRCALRVRSSWPASGWPRCPAPSPRCSPWPAPPAPGWRGCPAAPASAVPSRPVRCRTCCPAAAPVGDAAARAEVGALWGAELPSAPGPRHHRACSPPLRDGELAGLVVGGVDPGDLPDPALAEAALAEAGFVVSLEMFPTAVTEWADVVLPVAAAAEKAGSYLDWEGRARPFDATLHGTGRLPDGRVLHGLAEEMDADLRLPAPEAARAELAALGAVRRPG